MAYRHKKIGQITLSGSDSLTFYDMGDEHIGIIHFDLWEDIDSSAVQEYGKYNVQAGIVCLRGFESYGKDETFIGMSVHDALESSGWAIVTEEQCKEPAFSDCKPGDIYFPYDGSIIVKKENKLAYTLCIAETLWLYGAKDVYYDGSGNNRRKLEKEARAAI